MKISSDSLWEDHTIFCEKIYRSHMLSSHILWEVPLIFWEVPLLFFLLGVYLPIYCENISWSSVAHSPDLLREYYPILLEMILWSSIKRSSDFPRHPLWANTEGKGSLIFYRKIFRSFIRFFYLLLKDPLTPYEEFSDPRWEDPLIFCEKILLVMIL